MNSITLVFDSQQFPTDATVYLNDVRLAVHAPKEKNQFGDYAMEITTNLQTNNHLAVVFDQVDSYINLKEIIVDGIRFGLVTFLCSTIDQRQQTQLNSSGQIDIRFSTPIWEFWCQKMQAFNYKDYPLGSAD